LEAKNLNIKFVKDIIVVAAMKSIPEIKQQPLSIIIITFLSFIPLFFTSFFGGQLIYAVVGGMVCSMGFLGLSAAIHDIVWDRYVKTREMLVAMPVHPLSYSLGVAIAKLLFALPGFIIFITMIIMLHILQPSVIGLAIISIFLCWSALSSIGFLVSTYLRNANLNTLTNISSILGLAFILLPPVFYSEQLLGAYAWIGIIFPTSNVASLIRAYAGLTELSPEMISIQWLVLVATTIISLVLVLIRAKWRED
jgi:ABC-type multidrug transport system permease subunit